MRDDLVDAPTMIWRSGVDKRCDFFNQAWLTFTGRTLEQELGDGWAEGVHPDDLAECLTSYVTAFDARVPFRLEYRLRRFDGEYRWVLDIGTPRTDPAGSFAGYIGCCFDITDRKKTEEALEQAHAELMRVSRLTALGEFAAALSHELRQPLSAIVMNARSGLHHLAKVPLDIATLEAALSDIAEAGHRAQAVIAHNRELFRHRTVEASPLDINDVIHEVLVLSSARLRENHVAVVTTLADDLARVSGNRIELLQVLLNLVANAIDAMEHLDHSARQMTITSSRSDPGSVVVAVRDAGVGLDGVDLRRIFTISYTTKPAGTGVGLAVSRSIVEAHGGRIWAASNSDGGATFSFSLPALE